MGIKSNNELDKEIDVFARTLYGEARGEGLTGLEAVANVIMNRLKISRQKGKFWWGNDLVSICKKPYQFSCWNEKDVNLIKINDITAKDKIFATCVRIARKAVAGILKDNTNGATHYHAKYIEPFWAKNQIPNADIGQHLFYKIS